MVAALEPAPQPHVITALDAGQHQSVEEPPPQRHRYDGVHLRLVKPGRSHQYSPRTCPQDDAKLLLAADAARRPQHAAAVVQTYHLLRTHCARQLSEVLRPKDWPRALRWPGTIRGRYAGTTLVKQTLKAAAAAGLIERRRGVAVLLGLERDCCRGDLRVWPRLRIERREAERQRSAGRRLSARILGAARPFDTTQPLDNTGENGSDRVYMERSGQAAASQPQFLNGRKPSKSFSPAAQPAVPKAERPGAQAQAQAPAAAGGQPASASAATARNGDALGRRENAAAQESCHPNDAPSRPNKLPEEMPRIPPDSPALDLHKGPKTDEKRTQKKPIGFVEEQPHRGAGKGFARLAPVEKTKAKAHPPKDEGDDRYSEEAIQRRLEASRAARAACLQQSAARAAAKPLPALPAASTPKPAVEPAAEPAQPEGAPLPPQKLVSSAKALVSATDTCLGALQSAFSNKIHANQLPASMLPQAFGGLPPLASKAAQREPRYCIRFWSLEGSERQAMAQALVGSWETSASAPSATELDALRLVFPGLHSAPLGQAMASHKVTMWHLAEALKIVAGQPPGRPHSREALLVGLAQRLAGKNRSIKPR